MRDKKRINSEFELQLHDKAQKASFFRFEGYKTIFSKRKKKTDHKFSHFKMSFDVSHISISEKL